jgi:hypothetical protein
MSCFSNRRSAFIRPSPMWIARNVWFINILIRCGTIIPKPLSIKELAVKVREVLGEKKK